MSRRVRTLWVVLMVAGLLFMTWPRATARTYQVAGTTVTMRGRCAPPILDVGGAGSPVAFTTASFGSDAAPSIARTAGWLDCEDSSWWQALVGAAAVTAGAIVLVVDRLSLRAPPERPVAPIEGTP